MSSQEDMLAGPLPEIPDKLYFRIGDVARLANIKPTSCASGNRVPGSRARNPAPGTGSTGARMLRWCSKSNAFYTERFTIEGARKFLESRARPEGSGRHCQRRAQEGSGGLFVADPVPTSRNSLVSARSCVPRRSL
jgi:hypothetical protein